MSLEIEGKRVAIIGNGPSALVNKLDIDGFDVVVRFNRFQLGDDFACLGTRTDVICLPACNSMIIDQKLQRHTSQTRFILDLAVTKEKARKNHALLKALLPHAELVFDHTISQRVSSQLSDCRIATTGLAAIYWALQSNASEVYLTGFSFERAESSHYFTDSDFEFDYKSHDPIKELHWLADRADHPALRFDNHIRAKLFDGQPCDEVKAARERSWQPYSEVHRELYRKSAECVEKGSKVLEIGAGIGWGAQLIKNQRDAEITLVEPHKGCRNHLTDNGWSVLESLNEVRGHFDIATCVEVLEHLPAVEISRFLQSIASFTNRAIFTTPCRLATNHGRRTAIEWAHAFRINGWRVKRQESKEWTLFFEVFRP